MDISLEVGSLEVGSPNFPNSKIGQERGMEKRREKEKLVCTSLVFFPLLKILSCRLQLK